MEDVKTNTQQGAAKTMFWNDLKTASERYKVAGFSVILIAVTLFIFYKAMAANDPNSKVNAQIKELSQEYATQLVLQQQALMQKEDAVNDLDVYNKNIAGINAKLDDIRKQGFTVPEMPSALKTN